MARHSLQRVEVLQNQGLNPKQKPYSPSNTLKDFAASHFKYNDDSNAMGYQALGDHIGLL
jgi:hypothetical protein